MKHNKTLRRGLGILISLIMCLGLLPVTALAEETSTDVEISEANFPDATFRQYVSDEFDKNNDDYLDNDEIQAVTEIVVYDEFVIESLTGIEYFTELKELDCAGNQLTTLDISNNTKVEMLDCDNNSLTKLKIGKNESLTDLYCSYNQLTTLDVSQNTGLINLQCEDNNLTYLDVSSNEYLSTLYCSGNQLTTLDVSKNTSLTKLDCSENKLTFLDLSNTQVSDLSASDNVYEITLNEGRTFDLSTLPGEKFNVANVSSYDDSIGTIDNNTAVLTLASGADEFTYSYNCGKNKYIDFTLKVSGGGDTDDTTKYTVTVNGAYSSHYGNEPGETFTLDRHVGDYVGLLTGVREGYTLKDLTLDGITEEKLTWAGKDFEDVSRGFVFTMPNNNVTITINWTKNDSDDSDDNRGSGSSYSLEQITSDSKNDVNADANGGGKVKIDKKTAGKGSTVTITVTPDEGCAFIRLVVTDKYGDVIDVVDQGNGEYTFIMPTTKVNVEAYFTTAAEPEAVERTMILTIGDTAADVNGENVENDVAPVIRNERTMLPVRFVAEALGAEVAWDETAQKVTITKDDTVIEIYINQPFAFVNNEAIELDSPAFIENGRTYLPLRFIVENLGAEVTWDAETQKVTIKY